MRPLELERTTLEMVTVDSAGVVRAGTDSDPGGAVGITYARLRDELSASLSPEVHVRIVLEVLRALQPVHTNLLRPPQQRCHGTLHPGCIVINEEGSLSLFWQPMTRPSEQQRPYLAPEVRSGSDPDQQADIYSAGLMLYEAVTGRRVTGAAPDRNLPTIAPWAEPLLDVAIEALYRSPRRRWKSALAFAEGISAVAGHHVSPRKELALLVQSVRQRSQAEHARVTLAPTSRPAPVSEFVASSATARSGELLSVALPSVPAPGMKAPAPRHSGMWFSARRTPGFAWLGLSAAAVLGALLVGFWFGNQTEQVPIVAAMGAGNEWRAASSPEVPAQPQSRSGDVEPAAGKEVAKARVATPKQQAPASAKQLAPGSGLKPVSPARPKPSAPAEYDPEGI